MIGAWRRNFSLKQLSPVHNKPIIFVISQWQKEQKPHIAYLGYRWIVALYFFISLVMGIIDVRHPSATSEFQAKWLIYLTNWGFTICALQSIVVAFMLTGCILAPFFRNLPNLENNSLKFYKFYWITNIIATDIAFGITSLYWSLIYNENTMELDAMNFIVHASNSILMFLDLFFVSHPVRLLHCLYPVVFGMCYAIFSLIYYAAGGISREGHDYIYNILQWSKPGTTTIVCFAVICFIMIIHIVNWGLYKLRIKLYSKYRLPKEEHVFEIEPSSKGCDNPGLATNVV